MILIRLPLDCTVLCLFNFLYYTDALVLHSVSKQHRDKIAEAIASTITLSIRGSPHPRVRLDGNVSDTDSIADGDNYAFYHYLKKVKRLRYFDLSDLSALNAPRLETSYFKLKKGVVACMDLNCETLQQILCPANLPASFIEWIAIAATKCRNLERIHSKSCVQIISGQVIEILIQKCPRLKSITLDGNNTSEDVILWILRNGTFFCYKPPFFFIKSLWRIDRNQSIGNKD